MVFAILASIYDKMLFLPLLLKYNVAVNDKHFNIAAKIKALIFLR